MFDYLPDDLKYRDTVKEVYWHSDTEIIIKTFKDAYSIKEVFNRIEPIFRLQNQVSIYNVNSGEKNIIINKDSKEWFKDYMVGKNGKFLLEYNMEIPPSGSMLPQDNLIIYNINSRKFVKLMTLQPDARLIYFTGSIVIYKVKDKYFAVNIKDKIQKEIKIDNQKNFFIGIDLGSLVSSQPNTSYTGVIFLNENDNKIYYYNYYYKNKIIHLFNTESMLSAHKKLVKKNIALVDNRLYFRIKHGPYSIDSTLYYYDLLNKEIKKFPCRSGFFVIVYSKNYIIPVYYNSEETRFTLYNTKGKVLLNKIFKHKENESHTYLPSVSPSEDKLAIWNEKGIKKVVDISYLKTKDFNLSISVNNLYKRFLVYLMFHPLRPNFDITTKRFKCILEFLSFKQLLY